nr:unnamed protein product [Spirometra erinaceieuropaei]
MQGGDVRLREQQNRPESLNILQVAKRLESQELIEIADSTEVLTRERLCCGLVLFEQVLNRIREFLEEDEPVSENGSTTSSQAPVPVNVWHGTGGTSQIGTQPAASKESIQIEGCSQFHRIWSAIQFVFSTPFGENEYTVEEMFGDGLNWAGCAIICLLGQQRRFEMLDFGGQFLRIQRADKKDILPDGFSLARLATRLSRFSVLNRQIFATLNNYLHPVDRADVHTGVRHFPPPQWTRM